MNTRGEHFYLSNSRYVLKIFPFFLLGFVLINISKSDVGGAKWDSAWHKNLIQHVANYGRLPSPENLGVLNIPIYHIGMSFFYRAGHSFLVPHIVQVFLSIVSLFVFTNLIRKISKKKSIAILSGICLVTNPYFIASSYYITTDVLAIFCFVMIFDLLYEGRIRKYDVKKIILLNFFVTVLVLNRQMFVYLVALICIMFIYDRKFTKFIFYFSPSVLTILFAFYFFYIDYCDLINENLCATSQIISTNIPILTNLFLTTYLIAFFLLPYAIFSLNNLKLFDNKIHLILVVGFLVFVSVMVFFESKSVVDEGGAVLIVRNLFGDFSFISDILAFTIFMVISLTSKSWGSIQTFLTMTLIFIVVFSLLGPFAFQRYYEPYLLIVCLIMLGNCSVKLDEFMRRNWFFVLAVCQFLQLFFSTQSKLGV